MNWCLWPADEKDSFMSYEQATQPPPSPPVCRKARRTMCPGAPEKASVIEARAGLFWRLKTQTVEDEKVDGEYGLVINGHSLVGRPFNHLQQLLSFIPFYSPSCYFLPSPSFSFFTFSVQPQRDCSCYGTCLWRKQYLNHIPHTAHSLYIMTSSSSCH